MQRRVLATFAVGILAVALTACTGEDSATDSTNAPNTETTATENNTDATEATDIEFLDASVRAKPAADAPEGTEMTAIFGTLQNNTDQDIEFTGFTTSLGDASYEIHEVVDGVMQPKETGIVIPAGESHTLAPGAEHLMIMGYSPRSPPETPSRSPSNSSTAPPPRSRMSRFAPCCPPTGATARTASSRATSTARSTRATARTRNRPSTSTNVRPSGRAPAPQATTP